MSFTPIGRAGHLGEDAGRPSNSSSLEGGIWGAKLIRDSEAFVTEKSVGAEPSKPSKAGFDGFVVWVSASFAAVSDLGVRESHLLLLPISQYHWIDKPILARASPAGRRRRDCLATHPSRIFQQREGPANPLRCIEAGPTLHVNNPCGEAIFQSAPLDVTAQFAG
jgi:hypothetical protein